MHRSKDKPDFDDEEMFVLRLLQPHISTIFNIIHTVTAVKYLETASEAGNQKGLCLFDSELSLVGGNVAGIEILKKITVFGSSLLYHIKELCQDLLGEDMSAYTDSGFCLHRQQLLKTLQGDIKVDLFGKGSGQPDKNTRFVVVLEPCSGQPAVNYQFKFSKREAEIIDGLIQGKSNASIAKALSLSENTLKTHIKNIYRKTGTNNRTELTYILMFSR